MPSQRKLQQTTCVPSALHSLCPLVGAHPVSGQAEGPDRRPAAHVREHRARSYMIFTSISMPLRAVPETLALHSQARHCLSSSALAARTAATARRCRRTVPPSGHRNCFLCEAQRISTVVRQRVKMTQHANWPSGTRPERTKLLLASATLRRRARASWSESAL